MPPFSVLPPLSIYIHFPWCIKKCPYCDFNSHELNAELPQKRYVEALIQDLEKEIPQVWSRRIHSVFLGGGTPSLFDATHIKKLIDTLRAYFPFRPDLEITLEMNPGSFSEENMLGYLKAGINRLSIGAQSFHDSFLKSLGRIHDAKQIQHTFTAARAAGFTNINVDLMYGLPGQTGAQAILDIERALLLEPEHLSYYQLTIEPNTFFYKNPPVLSGEEQIEEMEQISREKLFDAGYLRYEVSAFAKDDSICKHNENYWLFGDYIGVGAGAHGKITQVDGIYRTNRTKHPQRYMQLCEQDTFDWKQTNLNDADICFEFLLNALRLKKGFSLDLFAERTGLDPKIMQQKLTQPKKLGLIEMGETIRASRKGYRHLNTLLEYCLPEQI